MPVKGKWIESVGLARNDRLPALGGFGIDEGVRVVTLIGDDELGRLILDPRGGVLDICDWAFGENDRPRITLRILSDYSMVVSPSRDRPISKLGAILGVGGVGGHERRSSQRICAPDRHRQIVRMRCDTGAIVARSKYGSIAWCLEGTLE